MAIKYIRVNRNERIGDNSGKYEALSYEASIKLRQKAWDHLRRINPEAAQKAWLSAQTR